MTERIAEVAVPGSVNLNKAIGIRDGETFGTRLNLPAPGGFAPQGKRKPLKSLQREITNQKITLSITERGRTESGEGKFEGPAIHFPRWNASKARATKK